MNHAIKRGRGDPPNLMELGKWVSDYYCAPMESVMRAMLPEAVREEKHTEKRRMFARLLKTPDEAGMAALLKKAPKQAEVLEALILAKEAQPAAGFSGAALKGLREKGWKIWRLAEEVAIHDADMKRFGEWWRRMMRAGYAFAEGARMHGWKAERRKEIRKKDRKLSKETAIRISINVTPARRPAFMNRLRAGEVGSRPSYRLRAA